jgi:serine/threonine-protein kinase/endoribonuclease IRE1
VDPIAAHLVVNMIAVEKNNRIPTKEILSHPLFWNSHKRLGFLRDASDRLEIEKHPSVLLDALERDALKVIGGNDWSIHLHRGLIDNLGRYRKYEFGLLRDLLRVIRNKSSHWRDLPLEVQQVVGPIPSPFLDYFLSKFPLLLVHVYNVIHQHNRADPSFHQYFHAS